MIKAKFTSQMIETLKQLKGKNFISYSASKEASVTRIFNGIVCINTDGFSVKLVNATTVIPWLTSNETEDIFSFTCQETKEDIKGKIFPIGEKIESVEVITDYVKIPSNDYEITLDMAVILSTPSHKYTFSRSYFFIEMLHVDIDKDFNEIYSIAGPTCR